MKCARGNSAPAPTPSRSTPRRAEEALAIDRRAELIRAKAEAEIEAKAIAAPNGAAKPKGRGGNAGRPGHAPASTRDLAAKTGRSEAPCENGAAAHLSSGAGSANGREVVHSKATQQRPCFILCTFMSVGTDYDL